MAQAPKHNQKLPETNSGMTSLIAYVLRHTDTFVLKHVHAHDGSIHIDNTSISYMQSSMPTMSLMNTQMLR